MASCELSLRNSHRFLAITTDLAYVLRETGAHQSWLYKRAVPRALAKLIEQLETTMNADQTVENLPPPLRRFVGEIVDVDSHEMLPAQIWEREMGPIAK